MRELSYEEKTIILRVALLLGILALLIGGIIVLNSFPKAPTSDPVPVPDYHMNPFGGLTP